RRPDLLHLGAEARSRGGHLRRRLLGRRRGRGGAARQGAGQGEGDRRHPPRRREVLYLEVLQRRLDARERLLHRGLSRGVRVLSAPSSHARLAGPGRRAKLAPRGKQGSGLISRPFARIFRRFGPEMRADHASRVPGRQLPVLRRRGGSPPHSGEGPLASRQRPRSTRGPRGPGAQDRAHLGRQRQRQEHPDPCARDDARDIVRNSASAPAVDVALPVDPFRLDPECREKPTSFETNFVRDGVRYQYGFSATREKIFEEWLYAYPRGRRQVWFERMGSDGWHFGPHLTGERERIRRLTRPDALYLSTAAAPNHEQLTRVYKWLASIDVRSIERRGLPFFLLQREEERTRDPAMRHRVLTLLRAADVGIADFRFDKAREDGDGIERLAARMGATRVRTLHQATR